ncbi:MAG: hypothetical protein WCF84_24475 [Anaerolineae bacterium]
MKQAIIETGFTQATAQTRSRYNRIAPVYDRVEAMSERRFKPWREGLWKQAQGKILEVGVGTGKTYPAIRPALW